MKREEFDAIVAAMRPFVTDAPTDNGDTHPDGRRKGKSPIVVQKGDTLEQAIDRAKTARPPAEPFTDARTAPFNEEELYQRFRARFIDEARLDPVLLHLILNQPEIIVEYERQVETLDAGTLKGRVARLIAQGWFSESRATSAVRRELARTGADPGGGGTLSDKLSDLLRAGFLVKDGDLWVAAPGVKVSEKEITR